MRRLLALLLAAAASGCNPEAIDPMKSQPRFDPYERTRFFADGMTMRRPPEGAVPRERKLGELELSTGRKADGSFVASIPIPVDRAGLQRGRERFEVFCGACHGLLGDGDSVPARKMSLRPPPSLHDFRDRPPGFFYAVIAEGFGMMPAYAQELSLEERWQVVAYLQVLFASQAGRPEQVPDSERRRLEQEQEQERKP